MTKTKVTRPLIFGAKGVMGRRYTAILRSLGVEPLLSDVGDELPKDFDGVLVTTPTALHIEHVEKFLPYGVPILCEKPFATSLPAVDALLPKIEGRDVAMVNQYRFLRGKPHGMYEDMTCYDYFNHGKDGLAWDCISVIALAKTTVSLGEASPRWNCWINGEQMSLADMDQAYIDMISHWLSGHLSGHGADYIRDAHEKVQRYIGAHR